MALIALIAQIAQVALPLGIQVFTAFKHNPATGNVDVTITLSQADAAWTADINQAQEWLAAHPATKPA